MDKFLNLFSISESQKEEMLEGKVEFSKTISQISSASRKSSKNDKCLYCGEHTTSYCNSHSIPASFLKNIAEEGKLLTQAGLIDLPLLKPSSGVNQAGTFYIICRDCDSKIFTDYENKSNYDGEVTQKILAQIVMKNYLKTISQRAFEISFHEHMGEDAGIDFSSINNIKDIDLKENVRGFNRAKKVDAKCVQEEYHLFFYEKLNYVVPIAFQHQLTLAVDVEGNVVNNLYNHDTKYKMQHLHLAVFPLEETSVVMMFIDKNNARYRQFIRQFIRLPLEDKLALVNYMIFLYSEDFFLSPSLGEDVVNDEDLKLVSGSMGIAMVGRESSVIDALKQNFDLSGFKGIPNLISSEHSVCQ
jgi:hypothetical protein